MGIEIKEVNSDKNVLKEGERFQITFEVWYDSDYPYDCPYDLPATVKSN